MTIIKDEQVLQKLKDKFFTVGQKSGKISYSAANAAYRTYRLIKMDGYVPTKSMLSDSTFYRHISMLTDIGFSKAHLQNMNGTTAEIIPFIRYIQVDFEQQYPDFAMVA